MFDVLVSSPGLVIDTSTIVPSGSPGIITLFTNSAAFGWLASSFDLYFKK